MLAICNQTAVLLSSPETADRKRPQNPLEMVQKVVNSPDPAGNAQDRLRTLATTIWKEIMQEDVPWKDLCDRIINAKAQDREAFFERWSTYLWDAKAVYAATEVHKKPKGMSLRAYVHQSTESFYTNLLDGKNVRTPKMVQSETPLRAIAPVELAEACQRVSIG